MAIKKSHLYSSIWKNKIIKEAGKVLDARVIDNPQLTKDNI